MPSSLSHFFFLLFFFSELADVTNGQSKDGSVLANVKKNAASLKPHASLSDSNSDGSNAMMASSPRRRSNAASRRSDAFLNSDNSGEYVPSAAPIDEIIRLISKKTGKEVDASDIAILESALKLITSSVLAKAGDIADNNGREVIDVNDILDAFETDKNLTEMMYRSNSE